MELVTKNTQILKHCENLYKRFSQNLIAAVSLQSRNLNCLFLEIHFPSTKCSQLIRIKKKKRIILCSLFCILPRNTEYVSKKRHCNLPWSFTFGYNFFPTNIPFTSFFWKFNFPKPKSTWSRKAGRKYVS